MKIYREIFLALVIGSLTGLICLTSCVSSDKGEQITIDSSSVIEAGLDHLYKTQKFAPDFYSNTVKIVRSPRVPNNLKFLINGKQIELVEKREGRGAYIDDLNHPLPFVDVTKLTLGPENSINLELEFPTIGFVYEIIIVPDNTQKWKVKHSSFFQT